MKTTAIVVLAVVAAVVAFNVLRGSNSTHASFLAAGTPTPVEKWEFTTMKSFVKDCGKPGSLLDKVTPHKCDPAIPDFLPEHSPAIDSDGTIYVGGGKGLYALNPDGSLKWSHGLDIEVSYRPILYTFIDDNGYIWFDFTVNPTAGLVRVNTNDEGEWETSAVHNVRQAGLLADGTIFALWDDTAPAFFTPGGVQQADSGVIPNGAIRQKWWDLEFGVPGKCGAPAFGANDLRYLGCENGLLVLKADGSTQWQFSTAKWAFQPAIAEDGTVYFGSGRDLYALNSDGRLKWKFATGDEVRSTPAIAKNGTVFFGSSDHGLYALGPNGKLKWKFEAAGQVYSPTVGDDGTIYALSADGKLHAIQDREPNGGLWGQWPKWAGDLHNTWRPAANAE
jgi:outer membrane protein assembly factor BamB